MVADTSLSWPEYLDGLIAALEALHIDGQDVDWQARRDRLEVASVTSDSEGYRIAAALVATLDDAHSRFTDALAMTRMDGTPGGTSAAPPSGRRLTSGLGYLQLPAVVGSSETFDRYAETVWTVLGDTAGACGWVIDLRGNTGGDVWVMLQALAPLLGDGAVLYGHARDATTEISVDDRRLRFDGHAWEDQDFTFEVPDGADGVLVGATATPSPYAVPDVEVPAKVDGTVPVAVLQDAGVASAGEIVVIALRGRPGPLRTFGTPTAGIPTGVTHYDLIDGSSVSITTHLMADRTGTTYRTALEPDQATPTPLEDAQTWLTEQTSCQ